MSQYLYNYKPQKKKVQKSKIIIMLLILGILISSTLLIPSPGTTLYYNSGHVKSTINPDGTQRIFYPDGQEKYNGEMLEGYAHGQGTYTSINNTFSYEGQWEKGIISGFGTSFYPVGSIKYQGDWDNGYYHGQGIKYLENETKLYSGDWTYGVPMGYGEFYDENNDLIYKGQVVNGVRHGNGQEYVNGKLHYDGLWFDNNHYLSEGTFYLPDGTPLSLSLGRYYHELTYSQGFDTAVEKITSLLPHKDIIENSTTNDHLKYLLYQHMELPQNYNNHTVRTIIKEFENIPISILEDLVALGITHRFINSNIANEPEFEDIRESSRGVSLNSAVGITSTNHNLLVTRLDVGSPPTTAIHELGHAVDFFLLNNISETNEFKELQQKEAAEMFRNRYIDTQYFIDYHEEYFAEFFAQYFLSNNLKMFAGAGNIHEIKERAPETVDFFQKHVVDYQSQYYQDQAELPPQLAAQIPIYLSFSVIDQRKEYLKVTLDLDKYLKDNSHNDIYLFSSNSRIMDLENDFNMNKDEIIKLIFKRGTNLSNHKLPYTHDSIHILYLLIDEDNNYSLGDTATLFPAEIYQRTNDTDPLYIETQQPLILGIWGKVRNFF